MQSTHAVPAGQGALAGAGSAVLAVGVTELLAALLPGVPSALGAVGAVVVDRTPGGLARLAIGLFGAADKAVLAVAIVAVAAGLGALLGRVSRGRLSVVAAGFATAAGAGWLAQLAAPAAAAVPSAVVMVVSVVFGVVAFRAVTAPTAMAGDEGRRRFLVLAGGLVGAGIIVAVAGRALLRRQAERAAVLLGLPAPDRPVAPPGPGQSIDVPGVSPLVVPAEEFYRVDTALLVPVVDPATWRLRVTGLVERPLELTLDDLYAMEQHERYVTIACVSNDVGGDLVGNARWQGVRLVELLEVARPLPGADQIVGRSVDGWTCGFPTQRALDGREPLVVVGMNGEPLPRPHGYPARLIVPGLYGYTSATKWLAEIELTAWDGFDAYWARRGWAKEAPVLTQSRIDRPRRGERVAAGPFVAAGVAWAPPRGIAAVEVQLDDGPWVPAVVTEPLAPDAWVQWRVDLEVVPGRHRLRVRATDGEGTLQEERTRPPFPRGATGWHAVGFEAV